MTALAKWTYELSYRFTRPGWDGDAVPHEVAALAKKGASRGQALDLGCGTGTNAISLARQGYIVTGVDFSPKAIALAQAKAGRAGVKVDFQIGDVTRSDGLPGPFDIALDVGCFHGLSQAERRRYVENLARQTRPASLFLLWAFEEQVHRGIGIGPEEVRESFAACFVLERIEYSSLHGRPSIWYWLNRR